MEKISKSSKKNRYANQETEKDLDYESVNKSYEKWTDESLLIRMDSPLSNKPDKALVFTQEFIKNLPESIVKKILEARSECSINFSRETRLLSQNNSCKGKIRELKEEIERLKLNIEEINASAQRAIEKKVRKKVLALEENVSVLESESQEWKTKYEALAETLIGLQTEKEKIEGKKFQYKESLKKKVEIIKAYENICQFSQIPVVVGKLEELEKLQSRIQEMDSVNLAVKDKNFKLQKEIEVLQLEAKNKENHIALVEMQVKSLEENSAQMSLRILALEQMLKDKDRSIQDLIVNFKLLQDELRRANAPKKLVDPNQGEVEKLKSALALKLLEKARKG